MPDAKLAAAVRHKLHLNPTERITRRTLAKLTQLHAYGSDLTGLEYATNLTSLTIGWARIRDIAPLANLTKLTKLELSGNQIRDITPLANLTNLTSLTIGLG